MKRLVALLLAASVPASAAPSPENLLSQVMDVVPVLKQVPSANGLWRDSKGLLWLKSVSTDGADTYWIKLDSLQSQTGPRRTLIVLGDHRANRLVRYRTSSMKIALDCRQRAWKGDGGNTFDASGRLQGVIPTSPWQRISVASRQEEWASLGCG